MLGPCKPLIEVLLGEEPTLSGVRIKEHVESASAASICLAPSVRWTGRIRMWYTLSPVVLVHFAR